MQVPEGVPYVTVEPRTRITLIDGFALSGAQDGPGPGGSELPRGVQRLVAHLCLSGRPPRAAIAGRLWPDVPEDHANGSLRSALWRLQKVAPGLIEVCGGSLCLAQGVRVDVRELHAWARRVRDPAVGLEEVEISGAGLCGELLPGWYDDWVLLERERLCQVRLHALECLADRLATAGRYGDALEAAYAAVRAEPLRESAHRTVVRVHLAEGNTSQALRAYEALRAMLADELGVLPSEHMTRLLHRIPRPAHNGHAIGTVTRQ
ncbi:AfsR/SARP family transcriptional regulator [Blastococcus tunisiensis]|uniref:DNA-binding transcriptional activator of the SARP family n=1 Tax=Blastococcus tunisiensis TaxID=1798228 RepID=A0A1I2DPU0_9ACTN|nr:BTAD domain-containing putative transcriptional regulator [Blastococcus sp. DSM 46838]SFE82515.1 DNA-binding transcriptional activator of the SARP family [Blastococcus sp. DSM 46838]